MFPEPINGPKVGTSGKSVAQRSREQYFNARLKNVENIKINYADDNVKGLLIANERLKSHAQIHDEIYERFRTNTKQSL